MPRPLWCALRLPQWPLTVFADHSDSPRAVATQHRVLRCCARSQAAGVTPGMKLATAYALIDDLQVLERDPAREQAALTRLAWQLLHFTPGLCLHRPGPAEDDQADPGLLLDIGGSLRLFGGSENLLVALHTLLRSLGHDWHTGVGHTPLAAWQLSHAPPEDSLQALRHADQADTAQAAAEAFCAALARQPVDRLALAAPLKDALAAPGFRTLGELLALPRPALGRRFGKALLLWCEQLLGERRDPRPALSPPERFVLTREFSDPVRNSQYLLPVMRQQLDALSAWLRHRQQAVRTLHWQLIDHQGDSETLRIRRARPCAEATLWYSLTERYLEQHRLRAPVLALTLRCSRPQAAAPEHHALIQTPGARADARDLLEKLACLPQLALQRLSLADAHLPEQRQQETDPLKPVAEQAGLTSTTHDTTSPLQRQPLWLLHPAEPLQQTRQGELRWRGGTLAPLLADRRLSLDWWHTGAADQPGPRDYFLARHLPSGNLCWIYRTGGGGAQQRQWFMQGLF